MSGVELHEVSGAIERPADCPVIVMRDEYESTITIPSCEASVVHYLAVALLFVVLATIIITGGILFVAHKPVFILGWIMKAGISPALEHYFPFWMLVWALVIAAGVWLMLTLLRPMLTAEELRISEESVEHSRRFLWQHHAVSVSRLAVRAFRLERDYEGLRRDRLMLSVRGAEIEIGEYIRPTDREWLASAANALLRE